MCIVCIIIVIVCYRKFRLLRESEWFQNLQASCGELLRHIRKWVNTNVATLLTMRTRSSLKPTSYGSVAAVGGAAVVGGAAAPTVAVMGVSAVGFTSTGIAAGSTAAGMMSSAAVGGVTTAGSSVAVLQSVGATGSLMAAGGAVVAGVVVVGAVISGCIGYGIYRLTASYRQEEDTHVGKQDETVHPQLVSCETAQSSALVLRPETEHDSSTDLLAMKDDDELETLPLDVQIVDHQKQSSALRLSGRPELFLTNTLMGDLQLSTLWRNAQCHHTNCFCRVALVAQ